MSKPIDKAAFGYACSVDGGHLEKDAFKAGAKWALSQWPSEQDINKESIYFMHQHNAWSFKRACIWLRAELERRVMGEEE